MVERSNYEFGYNRQRLADYLKEDKPKKKEKKEDIEIAPKIVAIVFLIIAAVLGFFIHGYLQQLKLEESPLKVGQIWEEEVIIEPEFTAHIETLYVKNTIIDLTPTRVKYIHGGEDTLEADHLSFMCTSRKLR